MLLIIDFQVINATPEKFGSSPESDQPFSEIDAVQKPFSLKELRASPDPGRPGYIPGPAARHRPWDRAQYLGRAG
jgi:hypothetical protein